jgi:putative ABC transport system permease protein
LPLTGTGANSAISRVGTTLPVPERPLSDYRSVSPEYFQTIGVPLESGRLFTAADRGRYVAVMSANLAAQAWPDEDPLGQHFRFGSNPASPLFEVIGIVGDVRNRSLDQAPTQTAYVPYPQGSGPVAALLVNVSGDTAPIAQRLREALRALDPDVPVPPLRMLDEVVDDSLLLRRFQLDLVVFFAMVAALLTVVGVYGLMAYAVAQRQNEFGVRLALGEGPRGLQRLVMRQATLLTLGGILVAVPFTLAAGSALQALLFGVTARDPLTFAIVGVLVTVAALAAAYFPARRASRIQPTVALRCE